MDTMKPLYSDEIPKRQRSNIEHFCHAADRFNKLKSMLKESEGEILEYKRSHALKNVERALKTRLITVYACHEMLCEFPNDPTQWPTQSDVTEVTDAAELEQHGEEKRKYTEMLSRGLDLGKLFKDADAVFGETKKLSYFRQLHESNMGSADSGGSCCSEEFSKLYETKSEVENVIKEKRRQIELKRRELELSKANEICGEVFVTHQESALENMKSMKAVMESWPRKAVQQNNSELEILVKCYENL